MIGFGQPNDFCASGAEILYSSETLLLSGCSLNDSTLLALPREERNAPDDELDVGDEVNEDERDEER
jgi:hypothetical protein